MGKGHVTVSPLDFCSSQFSVFQTNGIGLFVPLVSSLLILFVLHPLNHKNQFVLDFPTFFKNGFMILQSLILPVILLGLGAFCSYGNHHLYIKNMISETTSLYVQHLSQLGLILYSIQQCFYLNLSFLSSVTIQLISYCFYMKMHSFTVINRQLHIFYQLGIHPPSYPNNLTLKNYLRFLICPSVVYEPHFQKGNGFRLHYFIFKSFVLLCCLMASYVITCLYIYPVIINCPNLFLFEALLRILIPMLLLDIIGFYILFDCICNLLAEITNFANREFYQDWWNSTNFNEFYRRWNTPVYKFLYKHVYCQFQDSATGAIKVLIISACIHETILLVSLRSFRLYLLIMMLGQIPLMKVGKGLKGSVMGNIFFWIAISLGVPILTIAYGHDWAIKQIEKTTLTLS